MKKILNALFLTLLAVFTFSSCSDVPAPYDILGEGDVPGLTGDGSKDNPYTVSDLKAKADGTTVAWVQAYIVAGVKSSTDMSISSENDVVFGTQPTDVKATAFLIADDRGESDYKNCSAVNLSGKTAGCAEVKAALNLVDNATTPLPRLVTLKGTLVKNTWGLPGLKEVTTAVLEDGTIIGEGGDEPTPPGGNTTITENQPYSVSFTSDLAGFTVENKVSEGLTGDVWYYSKKYTAATSSSYNGSTNVPAEGWFLSPVLDMTAISKATLTFEHSSYSEGKPEELMLKVREENAANWTDLVISNYSNGRDNHVTTTVDLTAYAAKKAQIAFVYKNLAGGTNNTWYIYNLKVAAGEGGGETPTPPVEGTKIFVETFGTVTRNTNVEGYQGWDNSGLVFNVNNAKVNLRTSPHKTEANKTETTAISNIWFPNAGDNTFTISKINAAGYNKFVLYYEVAANTYNAGSSIDLNVLKVAFNGTTVVANSKVVTAQVEKEDANIFYEMQVELNVVGTANSTLEFSALAADNTLGLRLANIRFYAVGEGGGTEPEPTNLLTNSGFENWTADNPDDWARVSVTSVGAWEKSTDAYNNSNYSILVKGNSSNNRFGAKEVQLEVGKYAIAVYAKVADSASSGAKLKTGIVPINEAGSLGTYNYGETTQTAFEPTDGWAVYTNTIEVKAAGLYSVFLVNAKSGSNKNVLLDDVTLVKNVE